MLSRTHGNIPSNSTSIQVLRQQIRVGVKACADNADAGAGGKKLEKSC